MIAKCGCNCSKCPSFRANLKTSADREYCSRGWETYLQIKLKPEKLRLCDGCDMPDEIRKVSYLNCRVRKCAIFNGIKNCAYCSEYPCPDVSNLHTIQKNDARKEIERRMGKPVPEKDYLDFIEPYEGLKHLDEIRKSIKPERIVKMTPVKSKTRVLPFPRDLTDTEGEKFPQRLIYDILSTVETGENISFARRFILEKNRKSILKLLWAFGSFGEFDDGGNSLILDSEIYSAQQLTCYPTRVREYFRILEKYGLSGEIIPVDDKSWETSGGALRKKGWYMKLTAERGIPKGFFKLLKFYTKQLINKYRENAFGYFSRADLRVLGKDKQFDD